MAEKATGGEYLQLNNVLSLFQNVKGGNGKYTARCPVHGDEHNSLSISVGRDGRILIHCHAGCSLESVLAAVGLTMKDLFAESPEPKQQRRIVATYDYTDAGGTVLYQKVRYEPKLFTQRRPDGKGGWEWGRKGISPVLFNLPAVLAANTVYVVEGEKDCLSLQALGRIATTISDGAAGKWLPSYTETLAGKTVFIIPDNDNPGEEYALKVANALAGVAKCVKIFNLTNLWPEIPERGDLTDYLEWFAKQQPEIGYAGALASLEVMLEAAPEYKQRTQEVPALITLDTVQDVPPQYFWEPYLRAKNINVIRGDGGAGKTMLIMATAAAVTTGRKPDGMPGVLHSKQGSVLYYGAEDDNEEYKHRAVLCGCDCRYLHLVGDGQALPKLSDIETIRTHIKQTGAKLVVFDPIQYFLGSGTDMNKANEVRPLLEGLRAVCRETDCTAIIVEHLNKATQQKAHYRGIGTVDIINGSRSALMIGWHPEQQDVRAAVHIKANAKYGQPIAFTIDDNGRFQWQGTCDVTEDDISNAKRTRKNTSDPIDPVLNLVVALMNKHPEGWRGTAMQMLVAGGALVDCSLITDARSIGKRLPGIQLELRRYGITWHYKRPMHSLTKLSLLTPFDDEL